MAISSISTLLSPARAVASRALEAARTSWYLGFTSFGGPPVHFKILHDKYVSKMGWLEEQVYQEVFAVCQAFSGPSSTKMLYCIHLIHDGFLPAVLAVLLWCLPGAAGMYGLSIGVASIGDSLPRAVYALLSGLNAAVVGVILLAAVHLSQKCITGPVTRILVFLGATAGMMYNALWYFPVLMFLAGCVSVINDYRVLHPVVRWIMSLGKRREPAARIEEANEVEDITNLSTPSQAPSSTPTAANHSRPNSILSIANDESADVRVIPEDRQINVSWQVGITVITGFFITFVVFMVLRGTLVRPSLLYSLFANMYLAGTVIFGGGPVVIPLLREYVVAEGWVSPRDFLLGLAIIQAFPGPNSNFAVYLGSLTAIGGGYPSIWGAIVAYLGIFMPGLITVHGEMGLWSALRGKPYVKSVLKGVNAAAVGLIYTAVYRIWQIGYIDEGFQAGTSLGADPWWVVIAATSYVGGYWFKVNAPSSIILGAVMGLVRYGVVR